MLEQMLALEEAIKILDKACGQCSDVTQCNSIRKYLERQLSSLLDDKFWLFGYISGARYLQDSLIRSGWAITKGRVKREIRGAIKWHLIDTEWERGFVDAILDSVN